MAERDSIQQEQLEQFAQQIERPLRELAHRQVTGLHGDAQQQSQLVTVAVWIYLSQIGATHGTKVALVAAEHLRSSIDDMEARLQKGTKPS